MMEDKEILQKAIDIAIANGYPDSSILAYDIWWDDNSVFKKYYRLIFSHDFAKAFFGEELLYNGLPLNDLPPDEPGQMFTKKQFSIPAWKYRLTHMVLRERPLEYLRKFIKDI